MGLGLLNGVTGVASFSGILLQFVCFRLFSAVVWVSQYQAFHEFAVGLFGVLYGFSIGLLRIQGVFCLNIWVGYIRSPTDCRLQGLALIGLRVSIGSARKVQAFMLRAEGFG